MFPIESSRVTASLIRRSHPVASSRGAGRSTGWLHRWPAASVATRHPLLSSNGLTEENRMEQKGKYPWNEDKYANAVRGLVGVVSMEAGSLAGSPACVPEAKTVHAAKAHNRRNAGHANPVA